MKIKLDENLPLSLAGILESMGRDVDTLHEESLLGREDSDVWEAVQRDSRFLITQDLDFSDLRDSLRDRITAFSSSVSVPPSEEI